MSIIKIRMEPTVKRTLPKEAACDSKRLKLELEINLLDFSDCVLSIILSYLKPYDLYCLSKSCRRFKYLIKERKLWRRLDVLEHPMCARKFKFFFNHVNQSTDTILVCGISKKEKTLTFSQFIKLHKVCSNLTILAIENQYINSDEIGLKDFPQSLKELSLRGTHIYGRQPFLQDAHLRLHKLHTLILDDCKWFHEHSLMALSKLCSLENLSLYKCANLNDSVAYMSITAKFGFRKLLRIDARCTSIGDQFLKCFHCIKTLREIYLEAPERRESKKKPLFDDIKLLCAGDVQETSSAVVFNRNNIFKMRRDRIKSIKKPKSNGLPKQMHHKEPPFNCLQHCVNCTMETCSFMENLKPQSEAQQQQLEAKSEPVKPSVSASTSTSGSESPFETFFCDDVSDSEDEMVDFEIFHSDVTDSGVQWFCTSDPNATDYLGNESLLFRKPYKECTCRNTEHSSDRNDMHAAGPSGLNTSKRKQAAPSASASPSGDGTKQNGDKLESSSTPESSAPSPPLAPSPASPPSPVAGTSVRFHNDMTVNVTGKGAVCLKIAYDTSDTDSETGDVPAPANVPPVEARPQAHWLRSRDLRVIIERLDPGVHIVYDQGGRVPFDDHVNYYMSTKLKVFVARGYKLITNHALRSLMDLRLELLDVSGTSVSAKGVKEFLMVNPDCRVIHETTCACN